MATKNPLQIEVYCRDGATYHWRMWRSGQIVAESGGPGHVKQAQCKRTLLRLIGTLQAEAFVWKENAEPHRTWPPGMKRY
jgi:hypothetical protein